MTHTKTTFSQLNYVTFLIVEQKHYADKHKNISRKPQLFKQ